MVHLDVQTGSLEIHGSPSVGQLRQIRLWLQVWLGKDAVDQHTTVVLKDGIRQVWKTDAAFLHHASSLVIGQEPCAMSDEAETGRAMAEACRQHPASQRIKRRETLPTRQRSVVIRTSAWKIQVEQRRRAMEREKLARDAKTTSQPDSEQAAQHWREKWQAAGLPDAIDTAIITINVGPSGIQAAIRSLGRLVRDRPALPAVIHLQDIKLTRRRTKTIHGQLKATLPDYTAYHRTRRPGRGRRYNMGVTTLLRNDIAVTAAATPMTTVSTNIAEEDITSSEGRLLLLCTKPPGARGPVWHLNVYNHCADAPPEKRAALWRVCSAIIAEAQAQGAAVILAGDLNVTLRDAERRETRPASASDSQARQFVQEQGGRAATREPGELNYTWNAMASGQEADLDHIIAFPSDIQISGKSILKPLQPSFDHAPVLATFSNACFGTATKVEPDPEPHRPRILTQEHHARVDELAGVVNTWWSQNAGDPALADGPTLDLLLKGAAGAYADIAGWSQKRKPDDLHQRHLPGHRQLVREINALLTLRRQFHIAREEAVREGDSLWQPDRTQRGMERLACKLTFSKEKPLTLTICHTADTWKWAIELLNTGIQERRLRHKAEIDTVQQQQLQKTLNNIRDDFGRKKRTFRQALLRNPPFIPLWGVMSAHPNVLHFATWTGKRIADIMPDPNNNPMTDATIKTNPNGIGCTVTFATHQDLTATVLQTPPGECWVEPVKTERLVADPQNKAAGIDQYFGSNGLGALPRCAHHAAPEDQQPLTLSHCTSTGRKLVRFCNQCKDQCPIVVPDLAMATDFLPSEVFDGHNKVPAGYRTRIREPVSAADIKHVVGSLPLRKATGPDAVPNEVLRSLPDAALDHIRTVINTAFTTSVFPKSWQDVSVTLMTKKAPAEWLSNQRPIALCNTVFKLFSIILTSRLTRMVEETNLLESEQEGGRRQRGTLRQLQRIQMLFQDAKRRGKPIYSLFIDTKNAFGSVSLQVVWSILLGYGIPAEDVNFLRTLHGNDSFTVSGQFGDSAPIRTFAGIPQGCPSSPLLWNLVVNAMLRYLNAAGDGYEHESGFKTTALCFIDDAACVSSSERGMARLIARIDKFYKWAGLKINTGKCAIAAHNFGTNKPLKTHRLQINDTKLPRLKPHQTYKYLGVEIALNGSWAAEKARVRSKLMDCVTALKGSPYLSRQLEQVVRACLLPIFRYGAGLVDWSDKELDGITATFCNARRLAWKLPPGSPRPLHTLSAQHGGGQIPHAKLLWAKEMLSMWGACKAHDDVLGSMVQWEWVNSRGWIGCTTDAEAAVELTAPLIQRKISDLSNRFRRVCMQLGTEVSWDPTHPPPAEAIRGSLTTLSRPARCDRASLADSIIVDKVTRQRRLNTALTVLTRHGVISVHQLTLKEGQWIKFDDLPRPLRKDKRWSRLDHAAFTEAINEQWPQARRRRREAAGEQSQLQPIATLLRPKPLLACPKPAKASSPPRTSHVSFVSDHQPDTDSYLCHFKAPLHGKSHLPPDDWHDDWELAKYLVAGSVGVDIPGDWIGADKEQQTRAVCTQATRDGINGIQVTLQGQEAAYHLHMSGPSGLRRLLPPQAMEELARAPSCRIAKKDCSDTEWTLFRHQRQVLAAARAAVAASQPRAPAQAAEPDTGESNPQFTNFREQKCDSQDHWHPCQRSAEVTFNLDSMAAVPACGSQGTWTATTRHGQSVLREQPRPFTANPRRVKPNCHDTTIDTAQLQSLIERGAQLAHVQRACQRQVAQDQHSPSWLRALTSRLSLATGAQTLWGATAVGWDQQYPTFVSPNPEDVALGSTPFDTALPTVGKGTVILLDAFTETEQLSILSALKMQEHRHFTILCKTPERGSKLRKGLEAVASMAMNILPGQGLHAEPGNPTGTGRKFDEPDWATGNLRARPTQKWSSAWLAGYDPSDPASRSRGVWDGPDLDWDCWLDSWRSDPALEPSEINRMTAGAQAYWGRRQDGFLLGCTSDTTIVACDGSAGSAGMGAGAVFRHGPNQVSIEGEESSGARVGGPASSFRAEAAAMFLALRGAPPDKPVTILTDSMNVIHALQAWGHAEYFRDMHRQRHADIIGAILGLINGRSEPTHVAKVKSHRGVRMNEEADIEAGAAADADPDTAELLFEMDTDETVFTFTWATGTAEEPETHATTSAVQAARRWTAVSLEQAFTDTVNNPTMAGEFLTEPTFNLQYLAKSRGVRGWTTQEQRRWMQLVSRTFPVNTYLQRIGKHKTGMCPWCPKTRETQTHFQSLCPTFAKNRIAAHNNICRATMAAMLDLQPKGWTFYYEKDFDSLPFEFEWESETECLQQQHRRPDGIAYNAATRQLCFLEFTRAMDHRHTMANALLRKQRQYLAAERAAVRAQSTARMDNSLKYSSVTTVPFIFGTRGAVMAGECLPFLKTLGLKSKGIDAVLAAGVRAAISSAADMCHARLRAPQPPTKKP